MKNKKIKKKLRKGKEINKVQEKIVKKKKSKKQKMEYRK